MALSSDSYTFDALEKKYRNFYAPAFEVIIEGTNVVKESVAITTITVSTSTQPEANTASFTVNNAYDAVKRDFQWLDKYFVLGKTLEVKMGYTDKLASVFYGIITEVSVNYPSEGTPTLNITGMDMSTLMMKGGQSRSWENKKISDIAKEVGKKYVSKFVIDNTNEPLKTIAQSKMNDFKFLQYLAGMVDYDFFLVNKTMYFRKPLTSTTPVVTLMWGKHLLSFNLDMNLADQVTKVIVRGWDDKELKPIEATSKDITKLGSNSKTGKDLLKTLGEFEENIYTNVDSQEEAQIKADAMMAERSMRLITGEGECLGLPELVAGRYIRLDGLGKRMNQPYYMTSTKHTINSSGYITTFSVQGNAV
ncbi:phage late control D family protein [Paenibacillus sp. y28]|uniref:phage late control D family protein n=1 Tax=Paenibacillus sp. y28 TaxID=3129110 RepID=UPI003018DBA9